MARRVFSRTVCGEMPSGGPSAELIWYASGLASAATAGAFEEIPGWGCEEEFSLLDCDEASTLDLEWSRAAIGELESAGTFGFGALRFLIADVKYQITAAATQIRRIAGSHLFISRSFETVCKRHKSKVRDRKGEKRLKQLSVSSAMARLAKAGS